MWEKQLCVWRNAEEGLVCFDLVVSVLPTDGHSSEQDGLVCFDLVVSVSPMDGHSSEKGLVCFDLVVSVCQRMDIPQKEKKIDLVCFGLVSCIGFANRWTFLRRSWSCVFWSGCIGFANGWTFRRRRRRSCMFWSGCIGFANRWTFHPQNYATCPPATVWATNVRDGLRKGESRLACLRFNYFRFADSSFGNGQNWYRRIKNRQFNKKMFYWRLTRLNKPQ